MTCAVGSPGISRNRKNRIVATANRISSEPSTRLIRKALIACPARYVPKRKSAALRLRIEQPPLAVPGITRLRERIARGLHVLRRRLDRAVVPEAVRRRDH